MSSANVPGNDFAASKSSRVAWSLALSPAISHSSFCSRHALAKIISNLSGVARPLTFQWKGPPKSCAFRFPPLRSGGPSLQRYAACTPRRRFQPVQAHCFRYSRAGGRRRAGIACCRRLGIRSCASTLLAIRTLLHSYRASIADRNIVFRSLSNPFRHRITPTSSGVPTGTRSRCRSASLRLTDFCRCSHDGAARFFQRSRPHRNVREKPEFVCQSQRVSVIG